MSTARERARDAAWELAISEGFGAAQYAKWETWDMADVASAVWEKIVKEIHQLSKVSDPREAGPEALLSLVLEALGRIEYLTREALG